MPEHYLMEMIDTWSKARSQFKKKGWSERDIEEQRKAWFSEENTAAKREEVKKRAMKLPEEEDPGVLQKLKDRQRDIAIATGESVRKTPLTDEELAELEKKLAKGRF